MGSSLEPITAISVPGHISGTGIIDDLCNRIAEWLSRSCDLRATDAYAGYSAKVSIELQLADVDTTEVRADVALGTIDPKLSTHTITLEPDVAGESDNSQPLEKPVVDPQGFVQAPAREKRIYVSRTRGTK